MSSSLESRLEAAARARINVLTRYSRLGGRRRSMNESEFAAELSVIRASVEKLASAESPLAAEYASHEYPSRTLKQASARFHAAVNKTAEADKKCAEGLNMSNSTYEPNRSGASWLWLIPVAIMLLLAAHYLLR